MRKILFNTLPRQFLFDRSDDSSTLADCSDFLSNF